MEWLLKWSTSGWPVTAGSKRTPNRRRKLDAFPDSSVSNDDAPDARRSLDDFVRSQMMEQQVPGAVVVVHSTTIQRLPTMASAFIRTSSASRLLFSAGRSPSTTTSIAETPTFKETEIPSTTILAPFQSSHCETVYSMLLGKRTSGFGYRSKT